MAAYASEMNSLRLRVPSSSIYYGALEWGLGNPKKVACYHGWLDNAASFSYLGPKLAANGYHVVAVDHLGHGRSSHLPYESSYSYFNGVSTIDRVLSCLANERGEEWTKPHAIIGHSMSTGQSMLFASAFPERVNKLVLIEGFGPLTAKEEDAATKLRNALVTESAWMQKLSSSSPHDLRPPKVYETVQKAIETRMFVVGKYPGNQSISKEAATAIVCRGVSDANVSVDEVNSEGPDTLPTDAFPVRFRHDTRLTLPSHMYLSPRQVLGYTKSIEAPTLLITAENGWPPSDPEAMTERLEAMGDKLTRVRVGGSHHCHLDGDTAEETSAEILDFLSRD